MFKSIPLAFFIAVLVVTGGCAPSTIQTITQHSDAKKLTASQLVQLVEGNTLFLHSPEEDSYLYFDPSSRVFGKDIYANKDNGKWDVSEDGHLCFKMQNWWFGDLKCYRVFSREEKSTYHLANSADVLEYSAEQLTGDAQNLYTATLKKKRSFRKSARNTEQRESAPPQQAVSDNSPHYATPSPNSGDSKATVKWIAKDCPGCNFGYADLKKAELVAARLRGADLHHADLQMANLRRADLQDADLHKANLKFANLPGANLKGADLREANLYGANLIRADLTGANLEGAILENALLESVTGLQ